MTFTAGDFTSAVSSLLPRKMEADRVYQVEQTCFSSPDSVTGPWQREAL